MRAGDLMGFMTELLIERKRNAIISVIMITTTFLLFLVSMTMLSKSAYEIQRFEDCFMEGTDTTYRLQVDASEQLMTDTSGRVEQFVKAIRSAEGIQKIGCGFWGMLPGGTLKDNTKFVNAMNRRPMTEEMLSAIPGTVDFLYVSRSDCEIFRNTGFEALFGYYEKMDIIPVLAGSAFRSALPMGSQFTISSKVYEVVGFTNEGDGWPANGLVELTYSLFESLDYCFVALIPPEQEEMMMPTYLLINPVEEKKVREEFDMIGEEFNAGVTIRSVKESMQEVHGDELGKIRLMRKLIGFLTIMCVLTTSTAALFAFILRRRQVGIWYANGISPKEVVIMTIIEQAIKVIVAAAIAYVGIRLLPGFYIYGTVEHARRALRLLPILAVSVWVVSSAIPAVYIARQSPIQLIRAKE